MSDLALKRFSAPVGAEVLDVDVRRFRDDDALPSAVRAALAEAGVLVFRGVHIDAEVQAAFCRRLGPIETALTSSTPVEGVSRITLDASKTPVAPYFYGNFGWHIDGCTPYGEEYPPMFTMLSAQIIADGGDTHFASTYTAYDRLSAEQKDLCGALRVVHRFEAAVRPFLENPTTEQLERLRAQPTKVHPLVWTQESGRRSLVIGTHADGVEGMAGDEGKALLADLLDRATSPDQVYSHRWEPGDSVIWDNRGLLHRVARYDVDQPREMFRTTVLGQEPIR